MPIIDLAWHINLEEYAGSTSYSAAQRIVLRVALYCPAAWYPVLKSIAPQARRVVAAAIGKLNFT